MTTPSKVTKEEFDAFIKAYPRPLERDVNATVEPTCVTFNDFTLGDWPKSVVASYVRGDDREPAHGWEICRS
jgi:hypothetical protein